MSRKIFISYNHKNQEIALKIRNRLVAKHWEVLIDVERMRSGENIEQFIMDCIRESDITLTLISANSLLSAWVSIETTTTNFDEKIRNRHLIPCYIDTDFMNRSFVDKAMGEIEENLKEIGDLLISSIEKRWGIEDLQHQWMRYLDMKANLPRIIGKLRDLLCIDLTDEHFEIGIEKVLADLGKGQDEEHESTRTTDWDNLIDQIENGSCAIFLGHGLLSDTKGIPSYPEYCDKLAVEYADFINMYYKEENFFLLKAPQSRGKFTRQIKNFYNTMPPDRELYQMLAEIPVGLYISVSPDNYLENAFGYYAQSTYFKDELSKGIELIATKYKPLIYHIFGSTKNANSLLLSHDDLFGFFQSILGYEGLPTSIKNFFKDGMEGEVVFLGFSFKKWYLQLLLRLFNLSRPENNLNRTAYLDIKPSRDEEFFATQHFQVEFIETHIKEFVTTLHQKCKERGILRDLTLQPIKN